MLGQARLQIGCFVLVDDVALGKFVKHGAHERQQRSGLLRVSGRTKLADSIAELSCAGSGCGRASFRQNGCA